MQFLILSPLLPWAWQWWHLHAVYSWDLSGEHFCANGNEAGLLFQLELSKGLFSRTALRHLGILEITPYVPKPVSGISHDSNPLFSPLNRKES